MKPDWNEAPGWARFVAMDSNGDWYWHEAEPRAFRGQDDYGSDYWKTPEYLRCEPVEKPSYNWLQTLESRP